MREQDLQPREPHLEHEVLEVERVLAHRELEETVRPLSASVGACPSFTRATTSALMWTSAPGKHRQRDALVEKPRVQRSERPPRPPCAG